MDRGSLTVHRGEKMPSEPKKPTAKPPPRARCSPASTVLSGPFPKPTEGGHPTTGNAYKSWSALRVAMDGLALPWETARCGIGAGKAAKFSVDRWAEEAKQYIYSACITAGMTEAAAKGQVKEFSKLVNDLDHTNTQAVEASVQVYADWIRRLWSTMVQKGQWDTTRWADT